MTISALVIEDSLHYAGSSRLTTLELVYPRFIHSEFMTHRLFSRNVSSSRAVSTAKLIDNILADTAMPIHWGKNEIGMVSNEEMDDYNKKEAVSIWCWARDNAISAAKDLVKLNAHKQIVNRILEPFVCIKTIVTATEFDNFFKLRRHKDAQPEIHKLADKMFEAMAKSNPLKLTDNKWHLPYVSLEEREQYSLNDQLAVSVSRCARVSYLNTDKKSSLKQERELFERLTSSSPSHYSPLEHQATPDSMGHDSTSVDANEWNNSEMHGNFNGFKQFRKYYENSIFV